MSNKKIKNFALKASEWWMEEIDNKILNVISNRPLSAVKKMLLAETLRKTPAIGNEWNKNLQDKSSWGGCFVMCVNECAQQDWNERLSFVTRAGEIPWSVPK